MSYFHHLSCFHILLLLLVHSYYRLLFCFLLSLLLCLHTLSSYTHTHHDKMSSVLVFYSYMLFLPIDYSRSCLLSVCHACRMISPSLCMPSLSPTQSNPSA